MWRPAIVLFGVAIAACWTDRPAQTPQVANHTEAPAPALVGMYACTITETGFQYPAFPCSIRQVRGHLVLAKLAGSVRFEGRVQPSGTGFRFDGQVFCPWGDCTEHVAGAFRTTAEGALVGTLGEDRMVVELVRDSGAYAGASYGGAMYGGSPYGGGTYGGPRNPTP